MNTALKPEAWNEDVPQDAVDVDIESIYPSPGNRVVELPDWRVEFRYGFADGGKSDLYFYDVGHMGEEKGDDEMKVYMYAKYFFMGREHDAPASIGGLKEEE